MMSEPHPNGDELRYRSSSLRSFPFQIPLPRAPDARTAFVSLHNRSESQPIGLGFRLLDCPYRTWKVRDGLSTRDGSSAGGTQLRIRSALTVVLVLSLEPLASWALCTGTPPTCNQCQTLQCVGNTNFHSWICAAKTNGTACDDGHYCTVGDVCSNGTCVAGTTRSCPSQGSCSGVCSDSLAACTVDPACNVGTISGTKTSESGSAFTSPGAVISTSPGTSSSPATDSSYSFSVTPGTYSVISTVPTGYSVRGSVNGAAYSVTSTVSVSVGQGVTVNVSWKYNPVTKLVVSGSSTVGACGSNAVTVVAQDAFGNQAIGYRGTVHLTSSDPAAVLPADHIFAAADNGSFTFQGIVLKTAGTQSVAATDTSSSTIS